MPAKTPALQTYAVNLTGRTNAAAQSSLLTGKPISLGLSSDMAALMVYENGIWQTQESLPLPEDVTLALEREAQPIKLTDVILPLILFEPTGQSTAFDLRLSSFDHSYVLSSAGDGRVSYQVAP